MSSALFLLLAVLSVGYVWQASLRARELAIAAAADTCRRRDAQLLDETVGIARIRVCRTSSGRLALQRTYRFEFSDDGVSRQRGTVIITGNRVDTVILESDRGE